VRIASASLAVGRLACQTVAVAGPEEMPLSEAVRRVADAVGKHPLIFPVPVAFHYALGWVLERVMTIPAIAVAQVRILAEGASEATPACDALPSDLLPILRFRREQILKGLPPPAHFGFKDLRCMHRR
jgi:NADH dehydrogenase